MINEFHLVCLNDLKPIQIIHLVSIATFVLIQPPEMCGRYSAFKCDGQNKQWPPPTLTV